MDNHLESYITEHLERYISYHLEKGYSKTAVKKALSVFGYSVKEIDSIINKVNVQNQHINKKYTEKELEGETYYYLRGMLSDYMKKQLEHGFELNDIKDALIKYGHHKSIVHDAADLLKSKKFRINHSLVLTLSIAMIIIFSFVMSIALEIDFIKMFLVMTPSFASLLLGSFFINIIHKKKELVPFIAVVVTIGLFMFIFPALENAQADSVILLIINAIIAFFTTFFYSSVYVPGRKK